MMKFNYLYRKTILNYFLLPFSWLYCLGFFFLKKWNLRKRKKLSVPIIIVGNLTVGGNGKTPLVLALVEHFKKLNYQVGVLTRGYRGNSKKVELVSKNSAVELVGDEAVLLAQNCEAPVVASPKRELGVELLLKLGCNLILSDDGLQRASLPRTIEIVVIDDLRKFGNSFCLPAGPLREPISRLKTVDLIIWNLNHRKEKEQKVKMENEFFMHIEPLYFQNLKNPELRITVEKLKHKSLLAVAALGNPEKFFSTLRELGLNFSSLTLRDHAFINLEKLPKDKEILMTEKDAVKIKKIESQENFWFLKVAAHPSNEFFNQLDDFLEQKGQI